MVQALQFKAAQPSYNAVKIGIINPQNLSGGQSQGCTTQMPCNLASSIDPSYNAVKIDIVNPQNLAGQANGSMSGMQQVYSYPQTSVYDSQMTASSVQYPYQQIPQQNIQQSGQYPQNTIVIPAQQQPVVVQNPEPLIVQQKPQEVIVQQSEPVIIRQPVPTFMPNKPVVENGEGAPVSVIPSQVQMMPTPFVQNIATVSPSTIPQSQVKIVPAPIVTPSSQVNVINNETESVSTANNMIDIASFAGKLADKDLNVQNAAIEEIADISLTKPEIAPQFLDTRIIDGLLKIVSADTKTLAGPTPNQLKLREKDNAKVSLNAEELKEARSVSPKEIAEKNKQYALFTIAILQKNLANEVEKQSGIKVGVKDLPAIDEVIQTAKSNPSPMIRQSALAALDYINKQEYAPVLNKVFESSLKDVDPLVKETAKKALNKTK